VREMVCRVWISSSVISQCACENNCVRVAGTGMNYLDQGSVASD
jgi:hypothetical protein